MRRWFPLFIALALLSALIGWRLQQRKVALAAQQEQRQARMRMAPTVTVASVERRDIVRTFEGVGTVEAPLNVKLAPKVTGRVAFLQVREGDTVRAGQVLVRIDPPDLQAQLRQRRAAVAQAEHKLAQARLAREPAYTSVNTQIRQQEAALASARANQEQVNQNYASQVAAAEAAIADMDGRVANAEAAIANAQAAIASATANLENARVNLERLEGLYQQGFIAAQEVDNARTAVKVQEAALTTAQGQLNAAKAQRASAEAQRAVAERQAEVVKNKGKADIALAKAQVEQAQAALELARANTAQKPAYDESLNALEADVAAARAALANTEALLADTILESPIDGVVTARYLDPGSLATPTQPVLAVQAIRQVWVTVPMPADVTHQLQVGQTGSVTLDGLPGETLVGRITQINPAADPASRQFSVRFLLDNPHGRIKPGMFARVSLEVERIRDVVVVPREGVKQTGDEATVVVVGPDSKAQVRRVTLGAADARGIAVVRGVRPGEKVVTLSAMSLKDGQEVRIAGAPGAGGRRQGRPGEGASGPQQGSPRGADGGGESAGSGAGEPSAPRTRPGGEVPPGEKGASGGGPPQESRR
ncbi:MAG: efflux RND transporter periplasmic adaptor subunit [Armatimonadota bacterium]|nr:efflux RND transporter periplasmic adaptor subunit [Armatimonadota bacterium]